MRKRTAGREAALKALYLVDLRHAIDEAEIAQMIQLEASSDEAREFARGLVRGARDHREEIDREIAGVAENWEIRRMAAVDRNVLRLAVHELLHRPDVPPKVAINEAVNLAKKYSTASSGAFVNGILDKVRERHGISVVVASGPSVEQEAAELGGEGEDLAVDADATLPAAASGTLAPDPTKTATP